MRFLPVRRKSAK